MPRSNQKRQRRWLRWILLSLAFLVVVSTMGILWQISSFFTRTATDQQYLSQRFPEPDRPQIESYTSRGLQVRSIEAGLKSGPRVLFVHGSPGSWRDYAGYLADSDLSSRARLLAFDRPGFGETGGPPEPSLENQSALAAPLLRTEESKEPTLVLGYSLGGPVAARMAVDFPGQIAGLVLVAPSIDPDLEELRWYNWLAALPGLSYFLPTALIHSNLEIFPLKKELLKLRPRLEELAIPTVVIQGLADGLVPPANADFVSRILPQARVVRVPGIGHGILWQSRPLIVQEILRLLDQIGG